jgi:hypothetical protein
MELATSKSVILAIQNLPPKEQNEVFKWVRLHKSKTPKTGLDEETKFWLEVSGDSLKSIWGNPDSLE